ncbi:MAG: ABC-three component system middle component 6 [Myxococcota bacterium]
MILPTKHVSTRASLLGLGAVILSELGEPRTVTSLWDRLRGREDVGPFSRFVLALDLLHMLSAVELRDGLIARNRRD